MRTQNGQFWPVPVLNLLRTDEGICEGDAGTERSECGGLPILAYQRVESVERLTSIEMERMAKIFLAHWIKHREWRLSRLKGQALAGDVLVLNP